MKLTLGLLVLLLAVGTTAFAQLSLTVPVTVDQANGVKFAVAASDPDDDNVTEADVTNIEARDWAIARCQDVFDSYVAQRSQAKETTASVRDKYLGLSDADKAAVEAYIDSCLSGGVCP